MNLRTKPLLFLVVAVAQTYGAIYDHISQLPTSVYDYIIVGGALQTPYHESKGRTHLLLSSGGTAGNVLANRLTESSSIQVLVLEAGGRWVARRLSIAPGPRAHRAAATKGSSKPSSRSYVTPCRAV